jgi:molecular chaperone HtpG
MTVEELEKNLGTIAESGTLAFKKQNGDKTDEQLIGQFGVGFYSAFMVADKIEVYTKSYNSDKAYMWQSKGAEGYTIQECEKDGVGTTIVLYIKNDTDDDKYTDFLEQYKISSLIKQYSDYIRYPIKMDLTRSVLREDSPKDSPVYETITENQTLNSMVPLWKKPKSQVKFSLKIVLYFIFVKNTKNQNIFCVFHIFSAYSLIARSAAKRPERAIFISDI